MLNNRCYLLAAILCCYTGQTESEEEEFLFRFEHCLPQTGKRKAQRLPAGATTVLRVDAKGNPIEGRQKEIFDLRGNLDDMWVVKESEHLPGSLGVFAKKTIPYDPTRQGIEFLKHILPMPGVMMTNDAAEQANREFACPTGLTMKGFPLNKPINFAHNLKTTKGGTKKLAVDPEQWTLLADPMSRAAIINSAAPTFATPAHLRGNDAQIERTNCEYLSMNLQTRKNQDNYMITGSGRDASGKRRNYTNYAIHVQLTKRIEKGKELLINYGSSFGEGDHLPACEHCQIKLNDEDWTNIGAVRQVYESRDVDPSIYHTFQCTYTDGEEHRCDTVIHTGCAPAHANSETWRCEVHPKEQPAAAAASASNAHDKEEKELDGEYYEEEDAPAASEQEGEGQQEEGEGQQYAPAAASNEQEEREEDGQQPDAAEEEGPSAMTDQMADLRDLMFKVNLRK